MRGPLDGGSLPTQAPSKASEPEEPRCHLHFPTAESEPERSCMYLEIAECDP